MMRARVIAPLVAAVLGIGGGVTTALVVPGAGDDPRASTFNDPLHLGIPLVDQDCTGEALLVVGYGNSVAPLGTAVANNGTKGVRYLRSNESCETILGPEQEEEPPTYVVYLGPYETLREPCETRMTPEHRGDFVTVLRSGNDTLVKCPCALPTSLAPELTPHMLADAEDTVWIRALQAMLNDYDPAKFPHSAVSGIYDDATMARVTEIQQEAPGVPTTPGVVDAATWQILTDRICRIYDY
jgi:Putative peptidoglycan binding domain